MDQKEELRTRLGPRFFSDEIRRELEARFRSYAQLVVEKNVRFWGQSAMDQPLLTKLDL
jgi:hypothetical protein